MSIFSKALRKITGNQPMTNKNLSGWQTKYYFRDLGQPIWSHRNYQKFAEEGYIKNVIVNYCINLICKNAAKVRFKLRQRHQLGENALILSHPLLDLLNNPNKLQHYHDFMAEVYYYKLIAGNSFILASNFQQPSQKTLPTELQCLRPDKVDLLIAKNQSLLGYRYRHHTTYTDYFLDPVNSTSEILHLKNFNPVDEYYGLSNVEAAMYSIDQHNEASRWNQALLQNGARPSGALIVRNEANGGYLSEEQFLRIKQEFGEEYIGANNAGKPLLLEGGLDWKEISLSPKDMDFTTVKANAARDIALAFGIPPQLLGIPGDNTYSNLAEGRLALWEETILPLVEDVMNALNSWLIPMFGEELALFYNKDNISALNTRRESQWARIKDADFLTPEEKRELLGINKHDTKE